MPDNTSSSEIDDFDRLLDEFIANQLQETEDAQEELIETKKSNKPLKEEVTAPDQFIQLLFQEEHQLYDAFANFCRSVKSLAQQAEIVVPSFDFNAEDLYPRYRPATGYKLNTNVIRGWQTMLDTQPIRLASLPAKASDEQILEFAERTTDENLQMSLIAYVEILIELEGCEICYNQRKAKAKKRHIEKQIYEEHQKRKEKMQRYVEAIKAAKLPIDAERLVSNFFKTAKKDPEGAQKMLENNPATFAPIQIEKIPPRFFGMIKPKPEDGIRLNKEIGRFLKNLKA